MKVYVIGSLRNEHVPVVGNALREAGHEVYDDWFSPGPEADDFWQKYEHHRGHTYAEAIIGPHADMVFYNDVNWLDWCDAVVLVMPAGRSGHLELGWALGQAKFGYVLFDEEPERFDIMYRFADGVFFDIPPLLEAMAKAIP